jgi:protein-S-isoprenylcysteine O-methyltransferase Ste14
MTKGQREWIKIFLPPELSSQLFFGVPIVVGLVIHFISPWSFLPAGRLQVAIGLPLIIFGIALNLAAVITLSKANKEWTFSKPPRAMVTHGVYRLSRNPRYLSFIMLHIGIAAIFNALWPVLFLPLVISLYQFFSIFPEERYLEKNFSKQWLEPKSRVRRWL